MVKNKIWLFGVITLLLFMSGQLLAKTVAWSLATIKDKKLIKPLAGWSNNVATKPVVKLDKHGLHFIINERGKDYRWKLPTGDVDLIKYPYLRITYRSKGLDKNSTGHYILYVSTVNKQRFYPLLASNIKNDGLLHTIEINLNKNSQLKSPAMLNNVVFGMQAATDKAELVITELSFYSNKDDIKRIAYISEQAARPIVKATEPAAESFTLTPQPQVELKPVSGWHNDTVRAADSWFDVKPTKNQIYNGNFEIIKQGQLADWSYEFHQGATGKVEWDGSFNRHGKAALKITKTNGLGYILVYSNNAIPVKPGDKISFQGYYHTENNRSFNRTLGMVRLSKAVNSLHYDLSLNGWEGWSTQQFMTNSPLTDKLWQKRKFDAKIGKGQDKVVVQLVIYGNPVTVWWDDLAIESNAAAKAKWAAKYPFSKSYFRKELINDRQLKRLLKKEPNHFAQIKSIKGKPVIVIDGRQPIVPVMFNQSPICPDYYMGAPFSKVGIKLQVVPIVFGRTFTEGEDPKHPGKRITQRNSTIWVGKNSYKFAPQGLDLLEHAIKSAPDTLFVLGLKFRFYDNYVLDNPETAWVNEHGERAYGTGVHVFKFTADNKPPNGRMFWPSAFSEKWQNDVIKVAIAFIAELKKRHLDKKIVGVSITGGHDDQFAIHLADYSPGALNAFRTYLQKKYKTEANLRQAWHNPNITFATASIPQAIKNPTNFMDPLKNMDCADFTTFIHSGVLKIQEKFLAAVKKAFGKPLIGIKYLMGNHNGSLAANWGAKSFMKSSFDMVAPQPTYTLRDPGLNFRFSIEHESYKLHKKIIIEELDLRSYFRTRYPEYKTIKLGRAESFKMWQSELRKLTGPMIAHNSGYWFYDMHYGWFQKEIVQDIGKDFKVYKAIQQRELQQVGSPRNVLVAIDETALSWTSIRTKKYILELKLNTKVLLNQLGLSGVDFDYMLLEDLLEKPALAQKYRVIVFNHSYYIDEQRKKLYDSLKNNRRTLVWLYAPGYINKKLGKSLATMEQLTGFKIGYATQVIDKTVIVDSTVNDPLSKNLLPRQDKIAVSRASFALTTPRYSYCDAPYFFIKPTADVNIIAKFPATGQGALAVKRFPHWTSIYATTSSGISPELFNNICRDAGAYVTTAPGVDLAVNNSFISIHGIVSGYYVINLPRQCNVRDLKSGKVIAKNIKQFQMLVEAQSTYWLGLE